jgi:PleD family two-component response regulator
LSRAEAILAHPGGSEPLLTMPVLRDGERKERMKDPKGKVVVVDDDKEMRSLIEDFLANEGYQVRAFPMAADALQAL